MGDFEQPIFDQNPVLSVQIDHVGQGTEGHQIEKVTHVHAVPAQVGQPGVDCGGQKKGHADPGQGGAGAGRGAGVDHGVGRGRDFAGQMVVGDDDQHAQLFGPGYGIDVRNARVHGDQKIDSVGGQGFQGGDVQAVAFVQAMRDMAAAGEPVAVEKIHQQGGGGQPVHIVVAPDTELFPFQQRFDGELGGLLQAGPFGGRGQTAQAGMQEQRHGFGRVHAAPKELGGQIGGDLQTLRVLRQLGREWGAVQGNPAHLRPALRPGR